MRVGSPINSKDLAAVHVAIVQGKVAEEIDAEFSWPAGRADEIYSALLAQEEVRQSNRRSPQVFADYALRSRRHMRALDDVYERAMGEHGNLQAAVAAVRAKQDVLDRTILRGQELGQITKKPQEHTVLIGHMDDAALQEMVARELRALQDLSARHGGRGLLDIQQERPGAMIGHGDRQRVIEAELVPLTDGPRPPDPLPPSRGNKPAGQAEVATPRQAGAGSGLTRPLVVRRKAVAPATR